MSCFSGCSSRIFRPTRREEEVGRSGSSADLNFVFVSLFVPHRGKMATEMGFATTLLGAATGARFPFRPSRACRDPTCRIRPRPANSPYRRVDDYVRQNNILFVERIPCFHMPNIFLAVALFLLLAACGGRMSVRPIPERASRLSSAHEHRGVYHTLQRGQTLAALSRAYQVPVPVLMENNGITDASRIPTGALIFIPGASRLLSVPTPSRSLVSWPLEGRITSGFGPRGRRSRHQGIDIDGVRGQVVRAAAGGRVVKATRISGYGRTVVIDHGEGLTTLYAHASRLLVRKGDRVQRGQPIAEVGNSGNAKGTHLHFEVRRNCRPVNPLSFLAD